MTTVRDLQATLSASQQRLVEAVAPMTADDLAGPSYCRDWTMAQLLSHIGSGAAIFGLYLDAGLTGGETPGRDAMAAIWDGWNAMTPEEQARQSIDANFAFLRLLESASDAQLDAINLDLFGMPTDAARLVSMRLSEHAVHSWDLIVMRDDAAAIPVDAVEGILDGLGQVVAWTAKPEGMRLEVRVVTTDPARTFRLSVADTASLTATDGSSSDAPPATAELRLPAESLVRLVYGRLDPAHTPATVAADGVDLETLRALFPGL